MSDVPGRGRAAGDDAGRGPEQGEPTQSGGPAELVEQGSAPAGPGTGGLGELLQSAQQALSAQAEAAATVVEGRAGGGVVTVAMTGAGEVTAVTLAPEVVDPDDVEMLEDLIVAALRDAANQVTRLQREALGAFGGLDASGLGDILGGVAGGPGHDPGSDASPAGDVRPSHDPSQADVPAHDDVSRPDEPGAGRP